MARYNIFYTGLDALNSTNDRFGNDENIAFFSLTDDVPAPMAAAASFYFIDWILPHMSGLQMVRSLRARPGFADARITLVLPDDLASNRQRALAAGADDYITGPLDRMKIVDRLLAVESAQCHPREPALTGRTAEVGSLRIKPANLRAYWAGRPLDLAPNEFRLIQFFAENPDTIHTRLHIMQSLCKSTEDIDERSVDTWVMRLRKALSAVGAPPIIRTVRNRGYILERF